VANTNPASVSGAGITTMIDAALDLLQSELNTFLKGKFRSDVDALVELGGVHDLTQTPQPTTLRLTLVRIEEERVVKAQVATRRRPDDRSRPSSPNSN
jgi:hypothetical protein